MEDTDTMTDVLTEDEIVATIDEHTIENINAVLDERSDRRVHAVMGVLHAHGFDLAPEDAIGRAPQLAALTALVDATEEDDGTRAVQFMELVSSDMPRIPPAVDAIIAALRALDAPPVVADEPPTHRAVCMEPGCGAAVTYSPTASGAGFFVLERAGVDVDAAFGIGPNGRPVCPHDGHGEMTLADETLPAADAFAQVAEKLAAPVQGDLPGILPAFNYQGCYLELEEKASEVNALHEDYLEAKEAASDAKKAWDKAAELYTKMALEFRRRRQAKGEPDAPSQADPQARALACVWDKAHPDDACPFCSPFGTTEFRDEFVRILGVEIAPKDAQAHADQVVEYRTKVDVHETADVLSGLLFDVHEATIAEWTPEDRAAARAFAQGDTTWDVYPAVFGRPHIVGPAGENAQSCQVCGSVLRTYDSAAEGLPPGARVRTDCPGEEVEAHRYPDTSKPKKRSRAKAEPPPEPEPPAAPKKRAKVDEKPAHKSFPKPTAKKRGKGRR